MTRETIGVVAAMPEEIAPLVRYFSARQSEDKTVYAGRCGRYDIIVLQSGMGMRHAEVAVKRVLTVAPLKFIVSCGVGGAVTPDLKVGQVVVGRSVMRLAAGDLSPTGKPWVPNDWPVAATGTIITTDVIELKQKVATLLAGAVPNAVLDMETAAVIETASAAGIPVLAVRGISDDAAEEFQFSLDEFTDRDLNLKISRVAGTVLKKPWIIPQLMRLARNTKLAAENVAAELKAILERG